jgi:DENN (AEX-3) domain
LFDVIYDEEKRFSSVIGETRDLLNEIETKKSPKVSRSLTEKRKEYVRRVSDIRMMPRRSVDSEITLKSDKVEYKPSILINKFQSYINSKKPISSTEIGVTDDGEEKLFDMLLLIGFDVSKSSSYIKMCYPSSAKPPSSIAQLLYPNQRVIVDLMKKRNQNLCMILTDEYGNQFYAYCRQLLPEGSENCLPLTYCIISKIKATGFYLQVLAEIESRHGQPKQHHTKLIQDIHKQSLPRYGETLQFFGEIDRNQKLDPMMNRRQSIEGNEKVLILRPTDSRQECDEFSVLYESTSNKLLMAIFGSLLIERKIILISNDVSKLSMTILALTSILYPFEVS